MQHQYYSSIPTTTKLAHSDSHFVMIDGIKPQQKKLIHFNTKYCNEFQNYQNSQSTITLPNPLSNVKRISLESIEIPNTFYNFKTSICNGYSVSNTYFYLKIGTQQPTIIQIPDGKYSSIADLLYPLNNGLFPGGLSISSNGITKKITINNNTGSTLIFYFATDIEGNFDKYNFKNKLGWLLGFREQQISIPTEQQITAPCAYTISQIKELYFMFDDKQNAENTTQLVYYKHNSNKQILAKIQNEISTTANPNADIIFATKENGRIIAQSKIYTIPTIISKFDVAIVDENDEIVNLNGLDYSFTISVE